MLMFKNRPKLKKIYGIAHIHNRASIKVLEKSGYRFESLETNADADGKIVHRQTLSIYQSEYDHILHKNSFIKNSEHEILNSLEIA